MKKRSLWILFISALLCLSMLLAACDSGETVDTEGTSETEPVEETETEAATEKEEIPEDEKVNYASILSEWEKYLTSVGEDKANVLYTSATHFLTESDSELTAVNIETYGKIAKMTSTRVASYDEYGEMTIARNVATVFYNLETGEKLNAPSRSGYIYDFEIHSYVSTYYSRIFGNAIIEIEDVKYINFGTEYESDWQNVVTYSYYDNNGRVLAEDLDEDNRAEYINDGNVNCLKIADKAYHLRDGDIILEVDRNDTYSIPDFDVEYNGYRYSLTSSKIQVINESYELVVNYDVPSYLSDTSSITVLANGDVYICAKLLCDDNAEIYDYIENGYKYDVVNLVVSIKTGKATEIDTPFVIQKLMSNYDTNITGIKLNGDYQYAEVVRINDKTLAKDAEFVILDNTLTKVAELPRILKNQKSLVEGTGNGNITITVSSVDNYYTQYTANLDSGRVSRYASDEMYDADETRTAIDGGFVREYIDHYGENFVKVYNSDLEVVYDLTQVDGYIIRGDHIYFTKTESYDMPESEDETYTEKTYYVGYISDNGSFATMVIGKDAFVNYMDYVGLYSVKTDSNIRVYNRHGYEISLDGGYYATSIDVVAEYESCIVVKLEQPAPTIEDEYAVVYKYYIIK